MSLDIKIILTVFCILVFLNFFFNKKDKNTL